MKKNYVGHLFFHRTDTDGSPLIHYRKAIEQYA